MGVPPFCCRRPLLLSIGLHAVRDFPSIREPMFGKCTNLSRDPNARRQHRQNNHFYRGWYIRLSHCCFALSSSHVSASYTVRVRRGRCPFTGARLAKLGPQDCLKYCGRPSRASFENTVRPSKRSQGCSPDLPNVHIHLVHRDCTFETTRIA